VASRYAGAYLLGQAKRPEAAAAEILDVIAAALPSRADWLTGAKS